MPSGRQPSVSTRTSFRRPTARDSDPAILLLDDPTSALAQREVGLLFAAMRRLRARGVTMIYITHRMNELFEIVDTCTVLRDGRLAGALAMAEARQGRVLRCLVAG